jgi:hypothetical protein
VDSLGSIGSVFGYGLFLLVAVVGPGLALQRRLVPSVDVALVLPLGLAACAGVYGAGLALALPWLFPISILLLDGLLLVPGRPWRLASGASLRGALPPFVAVVLLLAASEYGQNRFAADGSFVADGVLADDAAFHVGLSYELNLGPPPQVPGLSGFRLEYHLGASLVRAAALRWAGVHPYDSLSRFDNTLFALALILALRAATRALGGSPRAEMLVGWSVLASDLSFLPAWGQGVEWWGALFEGGTGLLSLVHANSLIPALALGLAALVALGRHLGGEGRGFLGLALLLAVATAFFKVFVALQLLLGLAAASVVARPRGAVSLLAVATGVATAVLALGGGGEAMGVVFEPFGVTQYARLDLGLEPATGAGLLAWTLVWLVVALGLRLLGLPAAVRAAVGGRPVPVALAVAALAGWALGLLFRISPLEPGASLRPFNEALYFFEQSGFLSWIFVATALGGLSTGGMRRLALLAVCAALALPSSVQFLWRKRQVAPLRISAPAVRAMRALAGVSGPGDVVLMRPELQRFPPPPLVLIGRRVPYTRFIPFFNQFTTRQARDERFATASAFFRTSDAQEARRLAGRLGARYVCLFGAEAVRFPTEGVLEPIFEEPRARVYRLR